MVQLIIPLLPTTVKPPIADLPRQGHNTIDLSTTDTFEGHKYNYWLPYSFSTRFEPAKRGQPLYKGHNSCIYTVSNAFFVRRLYLLYSYIKRGIKLGNVPVGIKTYYTVCIRKYTVIQNVHCAYASKGHFAGHSRSGVSYFRTHKQTRSTTVPTSYFGYSQKLPIHTEQRALPFMGQYSPSSIRKTA